MSISALRSTILNALNGRASLGAVTMKYGVNADFKKVQIVTVFLTSPAGATTENKATVLPGDDLGSACCQLISFYCKALAETDKKPKK